MMCSFARCAGYLGLDLPLGQRSAARPVNSTRAPSSTRRSTRPARTASGDRLLELQANDGGPDLPTVSARRQARGLWRLTEKSLATNAAALASRSLSLRGIPVLLLVRQLSWQRQ